MQEGFCFATVLSLGMHSSFEELCPIVCPPITHLMLQLLSSGRWQHLISEFG